MDYTPFNDSLDTMHDELPLSERGGRGARNVPAHEGDGFDTQTTATTFFGTYTVYRRAVTVQYTPQGKATRVQRIYVYKAVNAQGYASMWRGTRSSAVAALDFFVQQGWNGQDISPTLSDAADYDSPLCPHCTNGKGTRSGTLGASR